MMLQQFAALGFVVSVLGICLAMPALFISYLIPGNFIVGFMSCIIAFLCVDNYVLASDLQKKNRMQSRLWPLLVRKARIMGKIKAANVASWNE